MTEFEGKVTAESEEKQSADKSVETEKTDEPTKQVRFAFADPSRVIVYISDGLYSREFTKDKEPFEEPRQIFEEYLKSTGLFRILEG